MSQMLAEILFEFSIGIGIFAWIISSLKSGVVYIKVGKIRRKADPLWFWFCILFLAAILIGLAYTLVGDVSLGFS